MTDGHPSGLASRRQMLIGAGLVAAAGTRGLGWLAGRPARPALTAAAWNALRAKLSTGRLLRPGESGYASARLLFEPRFDNLTPAGVAYCATAADVAACLSFVRTFGIAVRVRCGGHSYAGWSSVSGGLVVDISAMDSFTVRPGTVRVGAGLSLLSYYAKLAARGLAVPGGSCPTVGLAGLTLGGGVGVLSRLYGLTCDNLEAVQIVTATGRVLECDASQHADLYWACCGGGGGNFGVVTAFTFRTHPLRRVLTFYLTWPWVQATAVVSAWQSWAPFAPDALWSNMHLGALTGGPPSITVGGTFVGSAASLDDQLAALYRQVGSAPSYSEVVERSFLDAMLYEAGCASIPQNACHTGAGGQLARVPSYAKSDFYPRKLSPAGIAAMVSGIDQLSRVHGTSEGAGTIAFDACGGAMNRVGPKATAFVHRDSLFLAQYSTVWTAPGSAAGIRNQHDWLLSYYQQMHRYAGGKAYQNYIDPGLTDWEQAYYGVNYPRLQQVKAKYDPGNLFRFPQSIRPA
ncbi:MAG TPA: FAD-binding oxidoreductase [Streptosporangiaceae bacterium]